MINSGFVWKNSENDFFLNVVYLDFVEFNNIFLYYLKKFLFYFFFKKIF